MREPQTKEIGGHTYTITPAPARRALNALTLIGNGDRIVDLCRLLLEDLSQVDGKALWPQFDAFFAGDVNAAMELLNFAIAVQGFSRAAGGDEGAGSRSEG